MSTAPAPVSCSCSCPCILHCSCLTLLARSHSMAAPSIEVGTEDRIGPAKARTSMVDGFPYKEEVGGSSPSVPTRQLILRSRSSVG
jgi:hypothetical protein